MGRLSKRVINRKENKITQKEETDNEKEII